MEKSLDSKLWDIRTNPSGSKAFILADAKDADMAFGITAMGPRQGAAGMRSLAEFRDQIREIVQQGLVDIMLLSTSSLEQLSIQERLFEKSPVTPAARANDTTDIWVVRGSSYPRVASRPFRTSRIEHILYGRAQPTEGQAVTGADLGLYSITFNDDLDWDLAALEHYRNFRCEAETHGFRHFLEVFNPNVEGRVPKEQVGSFLNDHIVRTLAGVPSCARPLFLKIPYNGPGALEELVNYDPGLVVGILGGSAGTTLDAFQLLHDARKHGARVALFGRKINLSESPLHFITYLRQIAEGTIAPVEAVRSYHADLVRVGLQPLRELEKDLEITNPVLRYG